MKSFRILLAVFFVGILLTTSIQSCAPIKPPKPQTSAAKAPPGQVKKVTGSQSAKPYAPGQQKKKN